MYTGKSGPTCQNLVMTPFELISLIFVIAAVLAWINHKFVSLPPTIGVMVIALGISLAILGLDASGVAIREPITSVLSQVDFSDALLDVLLAFLLFAGALHVNIADLLEKKVVILLLATLGVLTSTFLVACFAYVITSLLGLDTPFMACLLFGALISPTDPVAVLGILKSAGAPKSLETKITGESLFNDGIGVVLFATLLAVAGYGEIGHGHHETMTAGAAGVLLLQEVGGALILGGITGWITYRLLKSVDNYHVEVFLTLALCMGLYTLAARVHTSGPLAVVIAGLLIGNTGRAYAMSDTTAEHIDMFWELIDEILNVVLFVLIGIEILVIAYDQRFLVIGLAMIPLVLLARFLAVGGAVQMLRRYHEFTPHAVRVMTWGGLRGGISVALALSLPADMPGRDMFVMATYVIVVFSIIVQGLTIGKLVERIPTASNGPGLRVRVDMHEQASLKNPERIDTGVIDWD